MLWHRGDPAGWNRHESLGIRFKYSLARKIEDLLEMLLRTPLSIVYIWAAIRPPKTNNLALGQVWEPTFNLKRDHITTELVQSLTVKDQMTDKMTNHDISSTNKQTNRDISKWTRNKQIFHETTDALICPKKTPIIYDPEMDLLDISMLSDYKGNYKYLVKAISRSYVILTSLYHQKNTQKAYTDLQKPKNFQKIRLKLQSTNALLSD